MNIGIRLSENSMICGLDADCILPVRSLSADLKHFEEENIAAVGGRIEVMYKMDNVLERIQRYEYIKTFQITRRVMAGANVLCLISGAYGVL